MTKKGSPRPNFLKIQSADLKPIPLMLASHSYLSLVTENNKNKMPMLRGWANPGKDWQSINFYG